MYRTGVATTDRVPVPLLMRMASHPLRWALLTELACSDRRVRELVVAVDAPQNLVSYHLGLLRAAGLVAARRSSFDGRDSYYHLDLAQCAAAFGDAATALHPALAAAAAARRTPGSSVLFLCTGNSARSPMAEALLRRRGRGRVRVASAGSHPKPRLHPNAVRVMSEDYGIDLSHRRPKPLTAIARRRFDYVITLCDKVREFPRDDAQRYRDALEPARPVGRRRQQPGQLSAIPPGGNRTGHPHRISAARSCAPCPCSGGMIMAIASTQRASVRYLVDDVDRAVDFYTTCVGFTLGLELFHPADRLAAEGVLDAARPA